MHLHISELSSVNKYRADLNKLLSVNKNHAGFNNLLSVNKHHALLLSDMKPRRAQLSRHSRAVISIYRFASVSCVSSHFTSLVRRCSPWFVRFRRKKIKFVLIFLLILFVIEYICRLHLVRAAAKNAKYYYIILIAVSLFKCIFVWFIVFFSTCGRVRVWRCSQYSVNTCVCVNFNKKQFQGALQRICVCVCIIITLKAKLISQIILQKLQQQQQNKKVRKRTSFNSFHVCVNEYACVCVCCACLSAARRLPFDYYYYSLLLVLAVISLALMHNHRHLKKPPTQRSIVSQLCFEIKVYTEPAYTHSFIHTHIHACMHACTQMQAHPTVIQRGKVNVMREHAEGLPPAHKYKRSLLCVRVCN